MFDTKLPDVRRDDQRAGLIGGLSVSAPADALFRLLRPARLTAIVDIGANPIDAEPPYKQMLANELCTVTGFEPQADAFAELERRKGPRERYLPYAVGDGRKQSLHICRGAGWASLLPPDPHHLQLFSGFPVMGSVDGELPIETHRLDDIDEIGELDFLKIDIQGGEFSVFESGRCTLSRTVIIQTEVSFVTLYREQPPFGVIDTQLRKMGFMPHCFAEMKFRPIAPLVIDNDPNKPLRQIIEADIVYVRDFTRVENMTTEQWKHLALIAHHCYGSFDLALRAIHAAIQTGALAPAASTEYLSILKG